MNSVEKKIWNYFISKGLNKYGVAGLMGNLNAESGMNPRNLQNTFEKKLGMSDDKYTESVDNGSYNNFVRDSAGYGLAQWTYWSRKEKLLEYARTSKRSIGDLDMQLEFLYEELKSKYPTVLNSLKNATSVREASNVVLLQFERPADQSINVQNKRTNLSMKYYQDLEQKEVQSMKINVHAGHLPNGGAFGLLNEAAENRVVKNKVISLLQKEGHKVYDCTVDYSTSANESLRQIVRNCNKNDVDLDVSIHFNAAAKDLKGNGKTTGTEVLVYNMSSKSAPYAKRICENISSLGFKNRGVKVRTDLYYLKNTKAPALLIEVCFVDDKDDVNIYDADKIAKAIVEGILGKSIKVETSTTQSNSNVVGTTKDCPFIVQCLDNLNIRSTPGGAIVKANGCKKGVKYTIVKVEGNWGYLKSGAGWISVLDKYVKRS